MMISRIRKMNNIPESAYQYIIIYGTGYVYYLIIIANESISNCEAWPVLNPPKAIITLQGHDHRFLEWLIVITMKSWETENYITCASSGQLSIFFIEEYDLGVFPKSEWGNPLSTTTENEYISHSTASFPSLSCGSKVNYSIPGYTCSRVGISMDW